MTDTAEELWQKVNDYSEKGDHGGTIDCLYKLIGMGDTEAISSFPIAYYSYAVDMHDYAINLTDNGARINGMKQAGAAFYTAIDMALSYLKMYPEDMENGNLMGQLIVQSFASLYYEAASGYMYGRKVSQDVYELKNIWTEVYGNNIFINREWEKHHDEYVTSIPTGMSIFNDQDDSDRFIANATQNVLANVKDTAAILEMAGREYDALVLRTRMALCCAEGQNGNREYLLTAEWLYTMAEDVALKNFHKMGNFKMYEPWLEGHSSTTKEYYELMEKYSKLILSYKKQGLQPSFTRFYRSDAPLPQVTDNQMYIESVEKAKSTGGNSLATTGTGARYLSVISKITYSEYIPIMVFSSVCGFFLGGIFNAISMGPLGKWLGIVFFALSLVITLIRSSKAAINRHYESDDRKYLLVMLFFAALLNIHYIVGIVVFAILKLLSKKYQ